jgi:hypothetical protein
VTTYPLQNAAKMCKVGLGKMQEGWRRIVAHGALYQLDQLFTR